MDTWEKIIMDILGVIGILSMILAYLHLFRPKAVRKIDETGRSIIINMSEMIETKSIIWLGLFYLAAGVGLVYLGFLWGR